MDSNSSSSSKTTKNFIVLRLVMVSLLFAAITEAMPSLVVAPVSAIVEDVVRTPAAFKHLPDVIFARKRALDILDGDDFTLHKRALDALDGDGFTLHKRALGDIEGDGFGFDKRKRSLDQIEGDDMGQFRKRSLDALEGDGFGGLVSKRAVQDDGLRRALDTFITFRRLRRALDAIEGKGFGF